MPFVAEGRVSALAIYDGLEDEAPTKLIDLAWPGTIDRFVHRVNIEDHTDEVTIVLARSDPAFAFMIHGNILRVDYTSGDRDEFRVERPTKERIGDGAAVATVTARGIWWDLVYRSGVVRQEYANQEVDPNVSMWDMLGSEWLSFIASNSDMPSYFVMSTVDPTVRADANWRYGSPAEGILTVADALAIRQNAPVYADVVRQAGGKFNIVLLNNPAAGKDVVKVEFARNEITLREKLISEKLATVVVGFTSGDPGDEVGLQDAYWEITVKAGATIDFDLTPFSEAGQLDGMYLEDVDGTKILVNSTVAPNQVVLASAPVAIVGELVRFVADATGKELIQLTSPSAIATETGERLMVINRQDLPPIINLAPNASLRKWTGGKPVGWTDSGAVTWFQETAVPNTRYGLSSARVTFGAEGDYIETVDLLLNPTQSRRHLTAQVMEWTVTGAIRLEFLDYSFPASPESPSIWFPDTATLRARTQQTLTWELLGVFPGEDFYQLVADAGLARGTYRVRLVAETAGTEILFDAWQVIPDPVPREQLYPRSAAVDLWLHARDYLKNFSDKANLRGFDVAFIDDDSLGLVVNQTVGAGWMVEMTDAGLGVAAVTKRVIEVTYNRKIAGQTQVTVEQVDASLADRFLGRAPPVIRKDVPTNTQRPGCNFGLFAELTPDLEVSWDPVPGGATFQLRDVTGLGGTPKSKWENGVVLYTGRSSSWILKDKITTPQGALPSQIDDIMIEAFNHAGVPSKCYETVTVTAAATWCQAQNLLPDLQAVTTHCTPSPPAVGDPAGLILHTFLPLTAASAPSIIPGQTVISACHEGSAAGSSFSVDGVASRLFHSFIATFTRQRLDRVDAGGASNAWSHGFTTTSLLAVYPDQFMGVAAQDAGGGLNEYRQAFGADADLSDNLYGFNSSDVCCRETTSDHYGKLFQPGFLGESTSGGHIRGGWSYKRPYIECRNMANQRMRLIRNVGFKWAGATTITDSSSKSGTATWSMYAQNNGAGGHWDSFVLRDAGNTADDAVFLGSEHPDGRCWPGDIYTYDAGGALTVGGTILAVNAAGTLGLIESGFLYFTDWTLLGGQTLSAAEWTINGSATIDPGGLGLVLGGGGAYVLRNDVGVWPECVSEGIGYINSTTNIVSAIIATGSPDVRVGLRLTFDNGTVLDSVGVNTGDLAVFQTEYAHSAVLWPAAATQVLVEQIQWGAGSGEVCSRNVMLNIGSVCCTFSSPFLPGLPPVTNACLVNANIGQFLTQGIDDCAGGTGVGLAVFGTVQLGPTCTDLALPGVWSIWVEWFEEDPGPPAPTRWTRVRKDGPFDLLQLLGGVIPTINNNPSFLVLANITSEDPYLFNPNPGTVRARDGLSLEPRRWYARVTLQHNYVQTQAVSYDTPPLLIGTYGWCP